MLSAPYPGSSASGKGSPARVMRRWIERHAPPERLKSGGGGGGGARTRLLPRVFVSSRRVGDADFPRLYLGADAVVQPSRGEGWGRPQMEALAMARPLIATNFSGTATFLSDDVAYPLRWDGLRPAADDMNATDPGSAAAYNPWFADGGQRWAAPSVAHLRELMRRVVDRPEEAAAKGRAAREMVLRRFSPAVVAAKVRSELDRIEARLRAAGVQVALLSSSSSPPPRRGGALGADRRQPATAVQGGAAPAHPQFAWHQLPPATAIPTRTIGGSGGGSGGDDGSDLEARAEAARQLGFTRAAGGQMTRVFDTTTMTLQEVLRELERGKTEPRTTATLMPSNTRMRTRPASAATTAAAAAASPPSPLGAKFGGGESQQHHRGEYDDRADGDYDDGSIVLHPS